MRLLSYYKPFNIINFASRCKKGIILLCFSALIFSSCQRVEFADHHFAPLPDNTNTNDQKRLSFLTELINDDGTVPSYYYQRSMLNYKLARHRVALKDIEACIRLEGATPEYLYWKAAVLSELNDYEQALIIANQAVAKGVNHTQMDVLLGKLHYHNGNTADALQYLEKAYKLSANNPNAAFYLGAIFYDNQDTTSAIRELKNAIALKPSYTDAYLRMIDIYKNHEMPHESGAYIQKALENCDPNADLFLEVGNWLWNNQQQDSSSFWYHKALQIRPALWQANYQLAQYYIKEKKYALAESYYKEALLYNPNIKNGYYQIGYIYEYYLANLEEAKKAYQKALKLDQSRSKEMIAILKRIDKKLTLQNKQRSGLGL